MRNTIDNVGLQRLYQRKGFGVKPGETTKKDTKWMALNIGYEILHTAYQEEQLFLLDERRNFSNIISILFPLIFQFQQVIYSVWNCLGKNKVTLMND